MKTFVVAGGGHTCETGQPDADPAVFVRNPRKASLADTIRENSSPSSPADALRFKTADSSLAYTLSPPNRACTRTLRRAIHRVPLAFVRLLSLINRDPTAT